MCCAWKCNLFNCFLCFHIRLHNLGVSTAPLLSLQSNGDGDNRLSLSLLWLWLKLCSCARFLRPYLSTSSCPFVDRTSFYGVIHRLSSWKLNLPLHSIISFLFPEVLRYKRRFSIYMHKWKGWSHFRAHETAQEINSPFLPPWWIPLL